MSASRATVTVFGFHARASVRLAYRMAIPLVAALIIAAGASPDPSAFLDELVAGLSRTGANRAQTGTTTVPLLLALTGLGVASWAAPRVAYGARGWLLHLPASHRDQRNAVLLGLALAQAPIGVLWSGLWLAGTFMGSADWIRLAALPVTVFAVAWIALPCSSRVASVAAGCTGGLLLLSDSWLGVTSAALVVFGLTHATGLRLTATVRRPPAFRVWTRLPMAALVYSRVMGPRLLSALLLAALPLVVTYFFITNNTLPPELSVRAARLGGGVAIAFIVLHGVHVTASRRPPWRWARSLPWSSRHRVLADAACLATPSLAAAVVVMALEPKAFVPIAATIPYLAVRGAASIRALPGVDLVSANLVAAELIVVVGSVALWAPAALAALAATWPALIHAARIEKSLRVTRFRPTEHLADGDPQALSTS